MFAGCARNSHEQYGPPSGLDRQVESRPRYIEFGWRRIESENGLPPDAIERIVTQGDSGIGQYFIRLVAGAAPAMTADLKQIRKVRFELEIYPHEMGFCVVITDTDALMADTLPEEF